MIYMNLKIAIAQIKSITGDLEGNTKQIISAIERAVNEKVDIVSFPEASITGYCCGALFDQEHFILNQLDYLHKDIAQKVPKDLTVIIGFIIHEYKVLFVNGLLKVELLPSFKLETAKIAPILSITNDCGMPKKEANNISVPLTSEIIEAVNSPSGTILWPAVLIGSVKTNAPPP